MEESKPLFDYVHLTAREREWLAAMPIWSDASGEQIACKFDRLSAFQNVEHAHVEAALAALTPEEKKVLQVLKDERLRNNDRT